MSSISFWAPVRYNTQPTALPQMARQLVDEYFNLGGEVIVICGKELNGVEPMTLQPGKTVRWQTALKAASYMAFLFFRAANRLFPGLPLIPGVVVVQTVISCLPIAMLVMKAVLCFNSRFYLCDKTGSIPFEVKLVLDELLGSYGSVDRLPRYYVKGEKGLPPIEKMTDPIMTGLFSLPESNYTQPFFAIKMRRLDNGKEQLFCLYQPRLYTRPHRPLMWDAVGRSTDGFPQFLSSNLTGFDTGGLTDSQEKENFPRLQRMIQEGKATDLNDVEWEIIGHQKK